MHRGVGDSGALPEGWTDRFLSGADLEGCLSALDGVEHFHAATMRGRLLSLLMRRDEARRAFEDALRLGEDEPSSVSTLVRLFLLEVYRFENDLLDESTFERAWNPEVPIPDLPEHLRRAYPEIHYAWHVRVHAEALFQLTIAGDAERARQLFGTCAESDAAGLDGRAFAYLYAACCEHLLGNVAEAARLLETAELAVHAADYLLNQVHAASLLRAAYEVVGEQRKAAEWAEYVETRPCPEATRRAFVARTERLVEMSAGRGRVVLV